MDDQISADSVARRYAHRPGCHFVGYQEVAITVFLMDVRVVLLNPRSISPIDEFLLRSMSLSIHEPGQMAELLGLDPRTVRNRLVELRRAELIDVEGSSTDPDSVGCKLTSKGREVAKTLVQNDYTEETIKVAFHGFLRRPILIPTESLLRGLDVRESRLQTIRAIPTRYPRPDEIKLDELAEVIQRTWKRKNKGKTPELISVRSVLKGVKTMFLPAVMLQYELLGNPKERRQQVAFAVDGVVEDEYEAAFADCGGAEKHPELILPSYKTTPQLVAEFVPPHLAQKLGDLSDVDDLVEKLAVVSEKVESGTKRLESAERPDTRQALREELERQLAELERERAEKSQLEQKLAQRNAHRLQVYDCARLLPETLDKVKHRLVILSAFLSTDAVDRAFLQRLENALKRGVKVWIGYGMGKHGERQHERVQSADWTIAENELKNLRKRYKELFQLRDFGDTHEKILICDDEFVVSGSYNWLSFKANPKSKKRRQEDAIMVTMPELVEKYFHEITARFAGGV